MNQFLILPGLFLLLSLAATSPAAELPMEPDSAQVADGDWEMEEAPDAPWGVKSFPAPAARAAVAEPAAAPVAAPRAHVVKKKETLSSISRLYKTTVAELTRLNGLNGTVLQPGQRLIVSAAPKPQQQPPAKEPKPEEVPRDDANDAIPSLPPVAVARAETVRLQVYLDRQQFCPGRIDGQDGAFQRAAVTRIRSARPELAAPGALEAAARREVPDAYVTWTLRKDDFAFIHDFPAGWPAMASQKFVAYRTAWEFVAERYHVSEVFLRVLNPHLEKGALRPGDRFIVPAVEPFEVEKVFPQRAALFAKKGKGVNAVIRQKELMIDLFRSETLVASFPVTLGKPETRGKGDWTIVGKTMRPSYFKRPRKGDPAEARGRSFTVPPGPNNPVGVVWMSLQKPGASKASSQGLHGTYTPDTIGRATSLGCIRMANWDAVRAAKLLQPGATLSWR